MLRAILPPQASTSSGISTRLSEYLRYCKTAESPTHDIRSIDRNTFVNESITHERYVPFAWDRGVFDGPVTVIESNQLFVVVGYACGIVKLFNIRAFGPHVVRRVSNPHPIEQIKVFNNLFHFLSGNCIYRCNNVNDLTIQRFRCPKTVKGLFESEGRVFALDERGNKYSVPEHSDVYTSNSVGALGSDADLSSKVRLDRIDQIFQIYCARDKTTLLLLYTNIYAIVELKEVLSIHTEKLVYEKGQIDNLHSRSQNAQTYDNKLFYVVSRDDPNLELNRLSFRNLNKLDRHNEMFLTTSSGPITLFKIINYRIICVTDVKLPVQMSRSIKISEIEIFNSTSFERLYHIKPMIEIRAIHYLHYRVIYGDLFGAVYVKDVDMYRQCCNCCLPIRTDLNGSMTYVCGHNVPNAHSNSWYPN